ncbi:10668_t:CDS:1, partial [Gigaspora rosea]
YTSIQKLNQYTFLTTTSLQVKWYILFKSTQLSIAILKFLY